MALQLPLAREPETPRAGPATRASPAAALAALRQVYRCCAREAAAGASTDRYLAMGELSGPVAGQRRRREPTASVDRRAGAWLVWWVLLMSLWVAVDDSIALDELLAGAGAAALAAFLAELVTHQAATRFRMRVKWVVPALGLPGQVVQDTVTVFVALWRRLAHGEQPPSGFRDIPARFGDGSDEGVTRRVLLIGGRSVAPNTVAVGIDPDRDVMIVHQLVVTGGKAVR